MINDVCFSPDNHYLVILQHDLLTVYNIVKDMIKQQIHCDIAFSGLAMSPDGTFLASWHTCSK
jgi:hypothetical protein